MGNLTNNLQRIGFGGGCHWCTEAIFQALIGVERVDQGFLASQGKASSFSEGVIVHYSSKIINLRTLIRIHLHTHSATSEHSFRNKYRSAIYCLDIGQSTQAKEILQDLQKESTQEIITKILPLKAFKASREEIRDYFISDPKRPFCERHIIPKLALLMKDFQEEVKPEMRNFFNRP